MKRMTVGLIVVSLAASLSVAFPAAAGETPEKPTKSSSKLPKRQLVREMPKFAKQPHAVKTASGWQIVADVQLSPWRTTKRNSGAQWDKVSYQLQVSKKGQPIRTVSLAPKDQKNLLTKKRVKPVVVKKAGRYSVAIPLSSKVAKTLATQSRKQQRQRIRVTIEHRKDVRRAVPGRDVTQIAQSGPLQRGSRASSSSPQAAGAQLANDSNEPGVTFWLYNYTPFDAQVTFQGTQCISDTSYGGTIDSYSTWMVSGEVFNTGQAAAYSTSETESLSQGAVTALQQSATQASKNAVASGAALFTPEGAASAAVSWAGDFIVDLVKGLSANSCKNLPTLYTTSMVATSVGNESTTTPYSYNNSDSVLAPVVPTVPPTSTMINSTVGAQTSTQWHWNDNNPEPASNGAFNWAGGLISMAPQNNSWESTDGVNYNTNVAWYFISDGANQTGMGPEPNVWPPTSGNLASPSLTASWDSDGYANLTCDPGEWSVSNPWGDTVSMYPNPNGNTYTTNQAYLAWGYNGTLNGEPVYNQSFDDIPPVTAFSQKPQYQTIDTTVLGDLPDGTQITEWVCTVSASLQVQSWDVPSGWPASLGSSPNGAWWSAPNIVLTAPYVAP
jgi:hypothetical protein